MNFKVFTTIAVLFLIAAGKCQAKNILCLLGVGTETSHKWNKVLLKELGSRQHDLTIISSTVWSDEDENDLLDAKFIYLENTQRSLKERYETLSSRDLWEQSTWKFIIHWYDRQMATCRANLESVGLSEALHLAVREKRKFDVILYDITYGAGCLLHLAYLYGDNVPIIGITSGHLNGQILSQESGLNPALNPYILSDFSRNMNYWSRVHNTALYVFDYLYRQWVVKPVIEGLWSKNIHAKNLFTPTSLAKLRPRFKVILANYHPSLHTLQALPVNVIPVPGLHIPENQQLLDNEILEFFEDTKLAVILVHLDMEAMSSDSIQRILEVIKTFPDYGFIWNDADDRVKGHKLPKNLLLTSNVDTEPILAHDKVTCGVIIPDILAIQESLYHGVTLITVPTRPEQRYIVQRIQEQNLGINLQLVDLKDNSVLRKNLLKCLNEKSLRNNVNHIQQSLKEQQNPSLETATWWIEHILEHPQANDHLLRPQSETLGFIAHSSLDVIFIIQIFLVICVINTILVMRQTVLNIKKANKKSKKKEASSEVSAKKTKKSKPKTS